MIESKICCTCKGEFEIVSRGIKGSNGAFIFHYTSNFVKVIQRKFCHSCYRADLRSKWDDKKKQKRITYEKETYQGFLMRTYRNMLSRVSGIQSKKAHLYKGLEILDKEDFYNWALRGYSGIGSTDSFVSLYKVWVGSGYDRKLAPSIDRIDSSKGYTLENMRWLTHSENSRLGSLSRHRK